MTQKKDTLPEVQPADEQDVEGNNMYINPTISSDLARSRSRDLEREARERNRAKEAKRS